MLLPYLNHLLHLIYPPLCVSCHQLLNKDEKHICLSCLFKLPKTHFIHQKDNEMEKRFWGKVPVLRASSLYYFEKNSSIQTILHELKYRGNKEIGEVLGREMGRELFAVSSSIDVIVPVPLHSNRLKKRGYNQSYFLSKGIAQEIKKPIDTNNLIRKIENLTQTNKNLYERWINVENIFQLKDFSTFEGKHILLVDDVLTTGATVEACIRTILATKNVKISVATLAFVA